MQLYCVCVCVCVCVMYPVRIQDMTKHSPSGSTLFILYTSRALRFRPHTTAIWNQPMLLRGSDPGRGYQLDREVRQIIITWDAFCFLWMLAGSVWLNRRWKTTCASFLTVYKYALIIQGRAQMLTLSHAQLHMLNTFTLLQYVFTPSLHACN